MVHLVFVYGSLLSGLANHRVIEGGKKLGDFQTTHRYLMTSVQDRFPALYDDEREGKKIVKGELYEVDDKVLARLDILESNGYMYQRKKIPLDNYKEKVYCYFALLSQLGDAIEDDKDYFYWRELHDKKEVNRLL